MAKLIKGVNDLETLYPELAKEWHPTKNGKLRPSSVTAGSNIKVWWLLEYKDLGTGNSYDFEWEASVNARAKMGSRCPYLVGKKIYKGFNDLESRNPELAKEWHPIKNGDLRPSDVTANSSKKVWWLLPYDDPETGEHYDFEWVASVAERNRGKICPFLVGKKVLKGFNDLETVNPGVVKEWDCSKNNGISPSEVSHGSSRVVWWKCNKCGYEWKTSVHNRVINNTGCPNCVRKERIKI